VKRRAWRRRPAAGRENTAFPALPASAVTLAALSPKNWWRRTMGGARTLPAGPRSATSPWTTPTCPAAALPSPAAQRVHDLSIREPRVVAQQERAAQPRRQRLDERPHVHVLRRVAGVIVRRRGQRLDRFALADRLPPGGGRSSACLPARFRSSGPSGVQRECLKPMSCRRFVRQLGRLRPAAANTAGGLG
jgi:hypothetical protein